MKHSVRLGLMMIVLALIAAGTFVWLRPTADVRYATLHGETSVLVSLRVAKGATVPESVVVEVGGERLVAGRLR